ERRAHVLQHRAHVLSAAAGHRGRLGVGRRPAGHRERGRKRMRIHLSKYRPWFLGAGGVVLVAALAFAVSTTLSAQTESSIGYVDVDRIIEEYLVPVLDEPLSKETARLQAEFDAAAEGL